MISYRIRKFSPVLGRDDVHDTEWVPWVAADLVVNFDITRLISADLDALLAGEGVLQSVAEKN